MIVGTAGHIDHGKSALVEALTGRKVDRLSEERRRGITIELNFAPLVVPGADPIGIIDVPGHEDLVRTMIAGASGLDLVLLIVDLAEGPRTQTEEHLAILEQLGVARGIPVFTKADLVEPDWAELVVADVMGRLAKSSIRFEAPAVVSAVTGQGIDELRERIVAAAAASVSARDPDWFRLPVDRVFSVAGVGTVVTGTPWSGSVAVGDSVRIEPGGLEARIRSIESYGAPVASAVPGARTALGMTGVERAQVGRGQLVLTGAWSATEMLDVEIALLETAPHPLKARGRVRMHLGTAEVLARVSLREPVVPGRSGLARLRLEAPIVARAGDRIVLRSFSPVATIGGAVVLDPLPPRRLGDLGVLAAGAQPSRLLALARRRPLGIPVAGLPQLLSTPAAGAEKVAAKAGLIRVDSGWFPAETLHGIRAKLESLLREHHRTAPDESGMSLETARRRLRVPGGVADRVVKDAVAAGTVRVRDGIVAMTDFVPAVNPAIAISAIVDALEAAGLEPPTIDELGRQLGIDKIGPLLRQAAQEGKIQALDRDRYAAAGPLERFRETLVALGAEGEITPAAVRDRLGLTRKYVIPLLEWADRSGVTRRVGDARILVQNGR